MNEMKTIRDCKIHATAKVSDFVNLYECELGAGVFVGPFVEIQRGVVVGEGTRISSHSFLCEGVEIGKNCFIAHGVMFSNDKFADSKPENREYVQRKTKVGNFVRIGNNATILPVTIGDYAIIGAGAVVTKDVPAKAVIKGNPAKVV